MYHNTNIFNLETALTIVQSNTSEFKVEFDSLWQWCGYSTKANAKRTLENNFEEGFDFSSTLMKTSNGSMGRPSELIMLTVDCAKEFAMLAQTEQGKQVRRYFIQAEKQLRQLALPQLDPSVAALVATAQATLASITGLNNTVTTNTKLIKETNEKIDRTVDKFEAKSGISIYQYLKNNFPNITFGKTLVSQLGSTMVRYGYEVESTYFETEVGRTVNTYDPDAIQDCIKELVNKGSIVLYLPSKGKVQGKWHTKVKAMKRTPKTLYTQEEALDILTPLKRKEPIETNTISLLGSNPMTDMYEHLEFDI